MNEKKKLKKAFKSIDFLIGYIYTSDIAKYVYIQDFNALKRIKYIIEREKNENENKNKKH